MKDLENSGKDELSATAKPVLTETFDTGSETEANRSQLFIYGFALAFLAINIVDGILWDYAGNPNWSVPVCFFFDAIIRSVVAGIILVLTGSNLAESSASMVLKIVGCRLLGQAGFCLGAKSMGMLGAGTVKVLIQVQLLLTAVLRYAVLGEYLVMNKSLAAIAVTSTAICFAAFKKENEEMKDLPLGLILVSISVVLVSLFFVISEKLLKRDLNVLKGWDKQFLFAVLDVPICILFCFIDIAASSEKVWTWNIFQGVNEWTYSLAGNNVLFGIMMYFIFDWVDSVMVNIIFVLGMTFTWPIEVALGFANFQAVCVVFLVQTTMGCLVYEYLGIKKVEKREGKNVSV